MPLEYIALLISLQMDAREDLPKISVETEQDWRRLQRNISTAFLGRLDLELQSQGASHDIDTFLPHMNQVSGYFSFRRGILKTVSFSTRSLR
jgi:hypothetical protein